MRPAYGGLCSIALSEMLHDIFGPHKQRPAPQQGLGDLGSMGDDEDVFSSDLEDDD